jgi:O-antigen ligase
MRSWLRKRFVLSGTPVDRAVGLFCLAGVLSTLTSPSPLESLVGLKKLLLIPIVYVIAEQATSSVRARELARLFIIFAALVSLYGIAYHLLAGGSRLAATQALPITAGGLFMIAGCLAIPLLLFGTAKWERLWLLFSLGSILSALALTKTRGAWIGLLAGLTVMTTVRGWKVLLAALAVFLVVFLLLPGEYGERLLEVFNLDYAGVRDRAAMWRSGIEIVHDYPVTGVGFIDLQGVHAVYSNPGLRRMHGHLHNNFLQIAVTTGIFGLTFFLYLLFTLLREQVIAYRRIASECAYQRALSLGCLGASVGFIIHGLFECNLCDAEVVMLFWFVAGLSLGLKGGTDCASG